MPSNKDILEAQRYNRRRLVTAFMAGTPGGRELEARPLGRPLIVGAVLALVLVLVAVLMGRLNPGLRTGWENDTLVVVKGTGARYFTIDGVLRPVANVTSARLLADPSKFEPSEVEASTLAGIPRGTAVGILEAPDLTPGRDQLRSGQWTACATSSGKAHTWVGAVPGGLASADTAMVTAQGQDYVVTAGRRYPLDPQGAAVALGLDGQPLAVDASWLALFEAGSRLQPLQIPRTGQVAAGMPSGLATAVIGGLIEIDNDPEHRHFVVTGDGEIAPLTDVAYRLHRLGSGVDTGNPLTVQLTAITGLKIVDAEPVVPGDWPDQLGSQLTGDRLPCAALVEADGSARSALASIPVPAEGTAAAARAGVTVAGGSGALVRATAGGTLGAVSLVAEPGLAYGIGDEVADTLTRLKYTEADVHTLPAAWLALVPAGVVLSKDAAWQTVKA